MDPPMKKALHILILLLAINFLLIAGAAVWLGRSAHMDRQKLEAIREILFPRTESPQAATRPTTKPATQPATRLEQLLAREAQLPATERVVQLQRSFDAQAAILDHRRQQLEDLQQQISLAQAQLLRDRETLQSHKQELLTREQKENRLKADKGFQDSLSRYEAMRPNQVKEIFMGLDDRTVMNYLQAMEPRQAAKIIKEFKTPAEMDRIGKIMEMMRQAKSATAGAQQPATGNP
jgi:hypothetical protein